MECHATRTRAYAPTQAMVYIHRNTLYSPRLRVIRVLSARYPRVAGPGKRVVGALTARCLRVVCALSARCPRLVRVLSALCPGVVSVLSCLVSVLSRLVSAL